MKFKTQHQNWKNAIKAFLAVKFITLTAYIRNKDL